MSYKKVNELIKEDEELLKIIESMEGSVDNGNIAQPYLVEETICMLRDNSPFAGVISDKNKVALCKMLKKYFDKCSIGFMVGNTYEDKVRYGKMLVYSVETMNGQRDATINEINDGVSALMADVTYPAGEEQYKKFCLLQWTYTGHIYYFKEAGYTVRYSLGGEIQNTVYEMILQSANGINEMFDWVGTDVFDKAGKVIDKVKKSKGYRYADYAPDEIKESISIKQITKDILRIFPRRSPDEGYRKALSIAIRASEKKVSPLEIACMRNQYARFIEESENSKRNGGKSKNVDAELVSICEELEEERYKGVINSNHFAYKIIATLKSRGYTSCSESQRKWIMDAYSKLHGDADGESSSTTIISDKDIDEANVSSYSSISDILDEM